MAEEAPDLGSEGEGSLGENYQDSGTVDSLTTSDGQDCLGDE